MYGLGWYLDSFSGLSAPIIASSNFLLLVLSTLLIAAGGNIINDIYDVFPDAINKPNALIIGKHIEMKKALLVYLILNLGAILIAMMIGASLNSMFYLFLHSFSIVLLWLYSRYLKKVFFVGNVVVALLTGLIPILTGYFFIDTVHNNSYYANVFSDNMAIGLTSDHGYTLIISILLGVFAFLLNLAREILKDIEDVPGDTYAKARTIPIVHGVYAAKLTALFILISTLALLGWLVSALNGNFVSTTLPLFTPTVFIVLAIFAIFRKETQYKSQKYANYWLKLAMVAGIIIPVLWRLLDYYE
jgi:4-hydroxybenzoate polyprenyltransferase